MLARIYLIFPQLREKKHDIFDWGLTGANANLLDNLKHNPERKQKALFFF